MLKEEEKKEVRELYRRSGYCKKQVKILSELYAVPKGEILAAISGMPKESDLIRREVLKGANYAQIEARLGVNETAIRREKQKMRKEGLIK